MRVPSLSPVAYRRITLVAALALAGIIVTGGAVRLTGSGLGCSDWPACEPGRPVARRRTPGGAGPEPVEVQLEQFERRIVVDAERVGLRESSA